METITKKTIRVGNSAGVLLPREWINGVVEVKLLEPPLDYDELIKNILIIIKEKLSGLAELKSLAITGSYARGEETEDSDIDILMITNKTDEHLRIGKFDILMLTEEKLKEELEKNAIPLLPMLREAKAIINNDLISKYANQTVNKKNVKWYVETTKSMMKEVKKDIDFSKQINENVSQASAYSLILRLRTLYIIECMKKNRIWNKREFLRIVKKISGSFNVYEEYLKVKNKLKGREKEKSELKIDEAEKLMMYVNKKIKQIQKWLKGAKG